MRVSLSVFVHLCADSPPLWNEIKSEKWEGGGGGGCHSHAATGAPVVSLSPPACLTAVKTPQHPFTHVQMPPTDVKLTFGGGGEKRKWRCGEDRRGKLFQGQSKEGKLAEHSKEGKRVENASVCVITGASEEKSLSQAQTSAHRGGNLSG